MSKLTLPEVLIDATRLLESGELNKVERQAICETIRVIIDRNTVICDCTDQVQWLVAKSWSIAAGGKPRRAPRCHGSRRKIDWNRIRAIFAELPSAE